MLCYLAYYSVQLDSFVKDYSYVQQLFCLCMQNDSCWLNAAKTKMVFSICRVSRHSWATQMHYNTVCPNTPYCSSRIIHRPPSSLLSGSFPQRVERYSSLGLYCTLAAVQRVHTDSTTARGVRFTKQLCLLWQPKCQSGRVAARQHVESAI